ncbi:MAG: hypothetical protein AAGG81_04270 [Chlamydiota bacterium]
MSTSHLSRRKANAISNGVFLIALGVLFYTNAWWPGILVAIWSLLATRQFLTGRIYDLFISSAILLGLFFVYYLKIDWSVMMPVLLVVGGIYIIFREYYYGDYEDEVKKNEEIELELEEKSHDK